MRDLSQGGSNAQKKRKMSQLVGNALPENKKESSKGDYYGSCAHCRNIK